jgi:hypothetical protein
MPPKKPRRFAEGTEVPVSRSKAEIEALLQQHGANQRQFSADDTTGRFILTFRLHDRYVKIESVVDVSDLPKVGDGYMRRDEIKYPQGWSGWTSTRRKEWCEKQVEQREREMYRRLLLHLKAKLDLTFDRETFEREFLADIMLPNGDTLHTAVRERLEQAYTSGEMPPLLLPPRAV